MSNPVQAELRTNRLHLEPIDERHAAPLFHVLQDATIYAYTPGEPPPSVEYLRARFERLASRTSPDGQEGWLNWAVRLSDGGAYAGVVQATIRRDGSALLAYEFATPFRGMGYASEGCAAVLDELRARYLVARVWAHVDTRNSASIRLLERLGFACTDRIERADHFKGSWSDELVYVRRL